eukprot:TRINITY_DN10129_c0_g1_i2.p1 TRINITY_DN10129_c0_g1~~TRINITY_DN10129_c0_g1_i2.p1  ORF type:complete len:141 (-),score=29.75 TRINITY_DN10129_c0_g1_i2:6-428(-)
MSRYFFFFSSRRRHTRCREVSWARRCVQETGIIEPGGNLVIRVPYEIAHILCGIRTVQILPKTLFQQFNRPGLEARKARIKHWLDRRNNYIRVLSHCQKGLYRQIHKQIVGFRPMYSALIPCLLYTSDAADDTPCVNLCV